MTKKSKLLTGVILLVIVAVVLAFLFWPRSFPQIMGKDYDPDQLREITVYLSQVSEAGRTRVVDLPPEDPATEELLSLLEDWTYTPVHQIGSTTGYAIPFDYRVSLCMVFQEQEDGYPAGTLFFDGYPHIEIAGTGGKHGTYKLSQDQQQRLLDLLLAQTYEEQTP